MNRLHDLGAGVDRVDGAVEAAVHQVVEDLAADGPALAAGADDGHGTRGQHAANGVHGRDLLAGLEASLGLGRDRGRELDVDLARRGLHGDAEAALAEQVEHLVVLGQHVGLEDGDAIVVSGLGQALEQQRSQAAALERVRDRKPDLGPVDPPIRS